MHVPSSVVELVVRERWSARSERDLAEGRLFATAARLDKGDLTALADLPRLVARGLVLLPRASVIGVVNVYQEVLEPSLHAHAGSALDGTTRQAESLACAAEVIALFGLALPRIARQNGDLPERVLERLAGARRSPRPHVFTRSLVTDPEARRRIDRNIASVSVHGVADSLARFMAPSGVRWNDVVWAAQLSFPTPDALGTVRDATAALSSTPSEAMRASHRPSVIAAVSGDHEVRRARAH